RKGLVSDLTRLLRTHQCDLRFVHAEAIENGQARICFRVEVHTNKEVFDILEAMRKREPHARVEIDAATTPQRILNRLCSQHKKEELWDTMALERAFKEAMDILPSRDTHMRNHFNISRPSTPKIFFGRSREIANIQETLCNGEPGKTMVLYGHLRSSKSYICKNFVEHHILYNCHVKLN